MTAKGVSIGDGPGRTVLVVDDDGALAEVLQVWLHSVSLVAQLVTTSKAAQRWIERSIPDLVLLDLDLPDGHGLEVFHKLRARWPSLPIVIVTGHGDTQMAVEAMRDGAIDFLLKPLDRARLLERVQSILRGQDARPEADPQVDAPAVSRTPLSKDVWLPEGTVVVAPAMVELFRMVAQLAAMDLTVHIRGESGTGKEVVARTLHMNSARRKGPFVAINCAAIPEGVQESELFGHEKGAFTGAHIRHEGCFERADGGTLLLDEVAELSPALQARLLRALQDRSFYRVGGTNLVKVDIRIISATHLDLRARVAQGLFREDLYYRLMVFELEVPPLRQRVAEIEHLALTCLRQLEERLGLPPKRISQAALEVLQSYSWPGNIRELQNALSSAVVRAIDSDFILPEALPLAVREPSPFLVGPPQERGPASSGGSAGAGRRPVPDSPHSDRPHAPSSKAAWSVVPIEQMEKAAMEHALQRTKGNKSEACRLLKMSRTTFYRRLKQFDLD